MPSLQPFIDLPALVLLIVANSTPVVVAGILGKRHSAPLDGNVTLRDGRPLFGPHKTWRGLIAGTFTSGLAGELLSRGFLLGAAFGTLALAGDLCSSFVKRRVGRASGSWTPLLDQLPEALLPMMVLQERMDLLPASIVGTAVVFAALDLIFAGPVALR